MHLFIRKKKSGVTRMATMKVPKKYQVQSMFKLPTIITPHDHDKFQPGERHVCPEKKAGPDGSTDGATNCGECTHEHHSQNGDNWKIQRLNNLPLAEHIQKHLERVYDEARGPDAKLTRDGFIKFIQSTQGEEVAVRATQDEYTEKEFRWEWVFNYHWNALRPLRPDEMDYSKPISNYFISSSHNTYLDGDQLMSKSKSKLYRKVLERHCRCIEIDVWNGNTSAKITPTRSKSPIPTHTRHHSSSSLQSFKQLIAGTRRSGLHSRQSSAVETVTPPISPRERSHTLNPPELNDRLGLGRERARSKSSINNNEPIVLHATWNSKFSLTQPVGFREVCKAVGEAAFTEDNHLPIIISLEVHADLEQQEVMVDIMKEEWGDKLLDKPLDDCNPHDRQPLLEELFDKILIKVKRPPAKASIPVSNSDLLLAPVPSDNDLSGSEDERCDVAVRKQKELKVPICDSLAALAIYTHSEHWNHDFNHPASRTHSHIFSIEEKDILRLYKEQAKELLAHNRRYFMRAYPNPRLRFDSSNPDPSPFWRKGVQMVAMNWQDNDYAEMALNDAMFTPDTKGWVLKPRGYRSDDVSYEPEYRTMDLRITIYAGQAIPLPEARQKKDKSGGVNVGVGTGDKRFRPVVQAEIIIGQGDASGKFVQKTTAQTTDNPNWAPKGDGFVLVFNNLTNVEEELSFVRFKIKDESPYFRDQVAAWACIRLDRLQQGYRFIDLTDCKGNPSEGKLFVKIDKHVR